MITQPLQRPFLRAVAERDNITSIDNCVTRLRLECKADITAVNDKKIKAAGVAGVTACKTSVQVVA